jgi:hypothetical protein
MWGQSYIDALWQWWGKDPARDKISDDEETEFAQRWAARVSAGNARVARTRAEELQRKELAEEWASRPRPEDTRPSKRARVSSSTSSTVTDKLHACGQTLATLNVCSPIRAPIVSALTTTLDEVRLLLLSQTAEALDQWYLYSATMLTLMRLKDFSDRVGSRLSFSASTVNFDTINRVTAAMTSTLPTLNRTQAFFEDNTLSAGRTILQPDPELARGRESLSNLNAEILKVLAGDCTGEEHRATIRRAFAVQARADVFFYPGRYINPRVFSAERGKLQREYQRHDERCGPIILRLIDMIEHLNPCASLASVTAATGKIHDLLHETFVDDTIRSLTDEDSATFELITTYIETVDDFSARRDVFKNRGPYKTYTETIADVLNGYSPSNPAEKQAETAGALIAQLSSISPYLKNCDDVDVGVIKDALFVITEISLRR